MLEICVSGFLVVSFAASVLLVRALAVAKRADHVIYGMRDIYQMDATERNLHLPATIPSGND